MPDSVQAQRLMYDALKRIHRRCGYGDTAKDASEFLVAMMSSETAMLAHLASIGDTLRKPGGVDEIVQHFGATFTKMLRENLQHILDEEKKATRQ